MNTREVVKRDILRNPLFRAVLNKRRELRDNENDNLFLEVTEEGLFEQLTA